METSPSGKPSPADEYCLVEKSFQGDDIEDTSTPGVNHLIENDSQRDGIVDETSSTTSGETPISEDLSTTPAVEDSSAGETLLAVESSPAEEPSQRKEMEGALANIFSLVDEESYLHMSLWAPNMATSAQRSKLCAYKASGSDIYDRDQPAARLLSVVIRKVLKRADTTNLRFWQFIHAHLVLVRSFERRTELWKQVGWAFHLELLAPYLGLVDDVLKGRGRETMSSRDFPVSFLPLNPHEKKHKPYPREIETLPEDWNIRGYPFARENLPEVGTGVAEEAPKAAEQAAPAPEQMSAAAEEGPEAAQGATRVADEANRAAEQRVSTSEQAPAAADEATTALPEATDAAQDAAEFVMVEQVGAEPPAAEQAPLAAEDAAEAPADAKGVCQATPLAEPEAAQDATQVAEEANKAGEVAKAAPEAAAAPEGAIGVSQVTALTAKEDSRPVMALGAESQETPVDEEQKAKKAEETRLAEERMRRQVEAARLAAEQKKREAEEQRLEDERAMIRDSGLYPADFFQGSSVAGDPNARFVQQYTLQQEAIQRARLERIRWLARGLSSETKALDILAEEEFEVLDENDARESSAKTQADEMFKTLAETGPFFHVTVDNDGDTRFSVLGDTNPPKGFRVPRDVWDGPDLKKNGMPKVVQHCMLEKVDGIRRATATSYIFVDLSLEHRAINKDAAWAKKRKVDKAWEKENREKQEAKEKEEKTAEAQQQKKAEEVGDKAAAIDEKAADEGGGKTEAVSPVDDQSRPADTTTQETVQHDEAANHNATVDDSSSIATAMKAAPALSAPDNVGTDPAAAIETTTDAAAVEIADAALETTDVVAAAETSDAAATTAAASADQTKDLRPLVRVATLNKGALRQLPRMDEDRKHLMVGKEDIAAALGLRAG